MEREIVEIMQTAQCDRLHAERLAEYRNRRQGIDLAEVALVAAALVTIISVIAFCGGVELDTVALWLLPALFVIVAITGRSIE